MAVLVRAVVYAPVLIGLFLVFVPARILAQAGPPSASRIASFGYADLYVEADTPVNGLPYRSAVAIIGRMHAARVRRSERMRKIGVVPYLGSFRGIT